MASKDKKQTTAKAVGVRWKKGRSSELHNGLHRKEGRDEAGQFYANQEAQIQSLQLFCTMAEED